MKLKFSWQDFLWPHDKPDNNSEALAVEQMFLSTNFVGLIWGMALTLVFTFQQQKVLQILSGLFLSSMIFSLFIRSWTKKTRTGVLFQSFAFYFYLVGVMTTTGGILSPALIWLPLIIYYVYPLLGKKWTVFWVGLWTATNIFFWIADSLGWLPANILSSEAQRIYTILSVIFMLPLGFWLYSLYQKYFEDLRQVSQKQRMESSHLLHVISHDIRSPLQIIQSYTHLLKDDKGEKKLAFIAPIDNSVLRISNLFGQVRDYENLMYSKEKIPLEPVDLKAVMEETLQTNQLHFPEKMIQVLIDFQEPTLVVLANQGALSSQILCNILSNAFKFSAPQSKIEVSARKHSNLVILKIRDYGIGIPESHMENIFEFSKKTSRPGTAGEKGSGFGLPIAKMFLDQMNVPAQLKSWDKSSPLNLQGTEFTLTFKAVE